MNFSLHSIVFSLAIKIDIELAEPWKSILTLSFRPMKKSDSGLKVLNSTVFAPFLLKVELTKASIRAKVEHLFRSSSASWATLRLITGDLPRTPSILLRSLRCPTFGWCANDS